MSNCTVTVPTSNIRLIGCDGGDTYDLLGTDAGMQGVQITDGGMAGLIEAPIKVLERIPVRMDGAILRAVKTEVMEVTLELAISARHVDESFAEVDGRLREAFSFELDKWDPNSTLARLEWETQDGVRWLEVVLAAGQDWKVDRDPHQKGWWLWTVKLRAYDPWWKADDVIVPLVFPTAGTKSVTVSNPTGVPLYQQWVGTVAQWRLPDNSWSGRRWERTPGGRHPSRRLLYPALTAANGGLVVDYTPGQLKVRDKADTNLIARMPVAGDYPKYEIPPFCQPVELSVQAVSVPAGGAALKLIQRRQFRRPWGRV